VLLRENKPFVAGIAGTPFFMAPELFKHQGQRASDYWSLGVTLFWLAAGKMPFEGMTSRQQLMAARRGQVSWRLLPADLSPACVDLLRGLLEPAAELRYDATILACHPFLAPEQEGLLESIASLDAESPGGQEAGVAFGPEAKMYRPMEQIRSRWSLDDPFYHT